MFLNKQDLLKAKVLEGRFKIETYFSEYASYQMANDSESIIHFDWAKLNIMENWGGEDY